MGPYIFRLNPFLTNVFFLYTLKTIENQMFSAIFRGYRSGHDQEYETPLWALKKSEKNCFAKNYLHFSFLHIQSFIEIVYYNT